MRLRQRTSSESENDPYNMPTVAVSPAILPDSIKQSYGGYQADAAAKKKVGAGQVANSYVQPQQYGAYDFLRDDPSRRAQNTLAVIDNLHIKRHPSISAYLGSFLPGIFGLILLSAFGISLSLLSTGTLDKTTAMLIMIILSLGGLWGLFEVVSSVLHYLRIVNMEYKIDKGRFQVKQGIFGKTTKTYELLRVHDIELKQSFINRLTGDGTLIFHIENEPKPLVVKGLVKGKKLDETYQQFVTLVSLLRFNPNAKGFIQ
jgi:hypothetical protein